MGRIASQCGNCGFSHPTQPCPATNAVCMVCNNTGHYARNCRLDRRKVRSDASDIAVESRSPRNSCGFCGNAPHARAMCPASGVVCPTCGRIGHFSEMCKTPAAALPLRKSSSQASLPAACAVDPVVRGKSQSARSDHPKGCTYCGANTQHPRPQCPANRYVCRYCKKQGHFTHCCLLLINKGQRRHDHNPSDVASDSDELLVDTLDDEDGENDWIIEDERMATMFGSADTYGFTVREASPELNSPCKLIIASLSVKSQGYREQLQIGDYILKIDNMDAKNMSLEQALIMLFNNPSPHTVVVCSKITAATSERPPSQARFHPSHNQSNQARHQGAGAQQRAVAKVRAKRRPSQPRDQDSEKSEADEQSDVHDDDEDESNSDWIIEDERMATLFGSADTYGFTVREASPELNSPCKLIIASLSMKSQGYREQLQIGDYILKIDNKDAKNMPLEQALLMLFNKPPPHTVVVCSRITAKNPERPPSKVGARSQPRRAETQQRAIVKPKRRSNPRPEQDAEKSEDDVFMGLVRDVYNLLPPDNRPLAAAAVLEVLERYLSTSEKAAEPVKQPNYDIYQELLQLEDVDVIANKEEFECAICRCDQTAGEGVILKECLHTFCKDCLTKLVETSDDADIKCPFVSDDVSNCDTVLSQNQIKALVPEELFEKYMERCLALAEHQSTDAYHCTTPDCRGWCFIEPGVDNYRCPICLRVNCLRCKTIHEPHSCETYKMFGDANSGDNPESLKLIGNLLETQQAMRCPSCQMIVLKNGGCDGVTCTRCKTLLCWATKGPRWGPAGTGDTSGGCRCGVDGKRCHPNCQFCH